MPKAKIEILENAHDISAEHDCQNHRRHKENFQNFEE